MAWRRSFFGKTVNPSSVWSSAFLTATGLSLASACAQSGTDDPEARTNTDATQAEPADGGPAEPAEQEEARDGAASGGAETGSASVGSTELIVGQSSDPDATLQELGVPDEQFVHEISLIANQPEPAAYRASADRRFLPSSVELPSWLGWDSDDDGFDITVTATNTGLSRGTYYVVLPSRKEIGLDIVNLDETDPAPTHLIIRVLGIGFLTKPLVIQHYLGDEDEFCRVPIAGEAGSAWSLAGAPDDLFLDVLAGDSLSYLELKCDLEAWQAGSSTYALTLSNDLGDTAEASLRAVVHQTRLLPRDYYRVLYAFDGASQLHTYTYLDTEQSSAAAWSSSVDEPWLSVEPSSGQTRTPIRLSVDPAELAPGLHTARVQFSAAGHEGATLTVYFQHEPDKPLAWTLPGEGALIKSAPALFSAEQSELSLVNILTGERHAVADPRPRNADLAVLPEFSEDGTRLYFSIFTEPSAEGAHYDTPRAAKLWTYRVPELELLSEMDYVDLDGGWDQNVKVRRVAGVDHSWEQVNLQGAKSINFEDGRWGFIERGPVPGFDLIYDDGETIFGFAGEVARPAPHGNGHLARALGTACGDFFDVPTFECRYADGTPYLIATEGLGGVDSYALLDDYVLAGGTRLVHPDGLVTEAEYEGVGFARETIQLSETLFVTGDQAFAVGHLIGGP